MAENIYLFVPNVIVYFRLALAATSFYYMPKDHCRASVLYLLSGLLDHVDGYIAGILDQVSKLGAILDMLTDRCTTMCMCAALCHFYPRWMRLVQFTMALDVFSHWLHMHSTAIAGFSDHKKIGVSANPVLYYYYHSGVFLSTMTAANELFFCMLYLVRFSPGPRLPLGPLSAGLFQVILYICAPISLLKSAINILQMVAAAENMAAIDRQDRAQVAGEIE